MSLLAHISPRRVPLWPHSAHLPKMLYPIREIYLFFLTLPFKRAVFSSVKKLGAAVCWGWLLAGGEEEEHIPV